MSEKTTFAIFSIICSVIAIFFKAITWVAAVVVVPILAILAIFAQGSWPNVGIAVMAAITGFVLWTISVITAEFLIGEYTG